VQPDKIFVELVSLRLILKVILLLVKNYLLWDNLAQKVCRLVQQYRLDHKQQQGQHHLLLAV
jgi:hypothetical protein